MTYSAPCHSIEQTGATLLTMGNVFSRRCKRFEHTDKETNVLRYCGEVIGQGANGIVFSMCQIPQSNFHRVHTNHVVKFSLRPETLDLQMEHDIIAEISHKCLRADHPVCPQVYFSGSLPVELLQRKIVSASKLMNREFSQGSLQDHPSSLTFYFAMSHAGRSIDNLTKAAKGVCGITFGGQTQVKYDGELNRIHWSNLCLEMLDTLQCLHENGFVHGDVKPDNICFSVPMNGTPGRPFRVQLVDFGFARRSNYSKVDMSDFSFHGTPDYSSTSVLQCKICTYADDLEALLYSMLELLLGDLPWYFQTAEHAKLTNAMSKAVQNQVAGTANKKSRERKIIDSMTSFLAQHEAAAERGLHKDGNGGDGCNHVVPSIPLAQGSNVHQDIHGNPMIEIDHPDDVVPHDIRRLAEAKGFFEASKAREKRLADLIAYHLVPAFMVKALTALRKAQKASRSWTQKHGDGLRQLPFATVKSIYDYLRRAIPQFTQMWPGQAPCWHTTFIFPAKAHSKIGDWLVRPPGWPSRLDISLPDVAFINGLWSRTLPAILADPKHAARAAKDDLQDLIDTDTTNVVTKKRERLALEHNINPVSTKRPRDVIEE